MENSLFVKGAKMGQFYYEDDIDYDDDLDDDDDDSFLEFGDYDADDDDDSTEPDMTDPFGQDENPYEGQDEQPYGIDEDFDDDDDKEFAKDKESEEKKEKKASKENDKKGNSDISQKSAKSRLNVGKMIREGNSLKVIRTTRSCPFCKKMSIFTEPPGSALSRGALQMIVSPFTLGVVPSMRKTRYICLNPSCKAYFTKTKTRFIDSPTLDGAIVTSHYLDTPRNPFAFDIR